MQRHATTTEDIMFEYVKDKDLLLKDLVKGEVTPTQVDLANHLVTRGHFSVKNEELFIIVAVTLKYFNVVVVNVELCSDTTCVTVEPIVGKTIVDRQY